MTPLAPTPLVPGAWALGRATPTPAQFGPGDWSLADSPSVGGDKLTLTVIAVPNNGGSAITALEYRVGGGAAQTLSGTGTGARQITVLAATLASVELRAVNGVGAGPWSVAKTATPTAAAASPGITAADAVEDGATAWLWLDPAWGDWASVTAVEVRLNGGAATALPAALPGAHRVTGLSAGVSNTIEARVTVGGAPTAWASASVTPTASSMTRFAAWAEAPFSEDISAYPAVTHIGETVASTGAINKPLTLSTGEEIEYVGGAGQLWVAQYGAQYVRPPDAEIEKRHRFFEPGGRHGDLAPLATRAAPFKLRATGDGADQSATAIILGSAGVATRHSMSAVGLDADGDPVAFRFDRRHRIGKLLDGRPFVVAPAGVVLIANGGKQTIPVNRVATWRGASLCVVASAGLIPLAETAVTLTTAYARVLAEPDWTAWPATVNGAGVLTIQRQPESLSLYLQSVDTTQAQVRFRKSGATIWNPAQPLRYDDRTPTTLMLPVVPGNHRNVILHLEPDTAYEVEVMQGLNRYAAFERTLTLKPTKVSAALGQFSDVDVTITRSGSTVTATPTTGTPVSIEAPIPNADITANAVVTVEAGYTEGPAGTYTVNTATTTNSIYFDFAGITFKPGERMRVSANFLSNGGKFRFEPRVGTTVVSSHAAQSTEGPGTYDFTIPAGAENNFNLRIRALTGTGLNSTISDVVIERLDQKNYAEFHSGMVRGGSLTINATGVILRDVDVIAPAKSGVIFAAGGSDVRIVRGEVSSWGESDLGYRPENKGWGKQHDAAVEMCRGHTTNHDIHIIGLHTTAPRYPANTWEHHNPAVGTVTAGNGSHPYGCDHISIRDGSFLGGIYIADCSFTGDIHRPVEDSITGNNNKTAGIGGLGPNAYICHNDFAGMADDGLEIEGSNQCLVLLANHISMSRVANRTRSPRAAIGISTGYHGPTTVARNIVAFSLNGYVGPDGVPEQGSGAKIQRAVGSDGLPLVADQKGVVIVAHQTVYAPIPGDETRNLVSNSASEWQYTEIYNCLGRQMATQPYSNPAAEVGASPEVAASVIVAGNDMESVNVSPLPAMIAGTHIPTTYAGGGIVIPNINDAGPWATTLTPSPGAAQVAA